MGEGSSLSLTLTNKQPPYPKFISRYEGFWLIGTIRCGQRHRLPLATGPMHVMKSVDYLNTRNSGSAAIIDFADTHSYRLARSLAYVQNGAGCLPSRRHQMTRGIAVLPPFTLSPFCRSYCNHEPFSLLRNGRGQTAHETHRDNLIPRHSIALPPLLSGYDYCYVYSYLSLLLCSLLYSSHSVVVPPAAVYHNNNNNNNNKSH